MNQEKFNTGDLVTINLSRSLASINGEYFWFAKGDLFLIVSKNLKPIDFFLHEYTILSMSGVYIEIYIDVLEGAFSIVN
jgi:hypothetical protein